MIIHDTENTSNSILSEVHKIGKMISFGIALLKWIILLIFLGVSSEILTNYLIRIINFGDHPLTLTDFSALTTFFLVSMQDPCKCHVICLLGIKGYMLIQFTNS